MSHGFYVETSQTRFPCAPTVRPGAMIFEKHKLQRPRAKGADMRTPIDDVVVFDGNRKAFETVLNITKDHDKPVRMFMYGPKGSGKSTLLFARATDRDLLSLKKVGHCHASQLVMMVSSDAPNEEYLFRVGSVDVLLIDGFDDFNDEDGAGMELCKLLVRERDRQGLETVIASDAPLDSFDTTELEGALDTFDFVEVAPLDDAGRIEFARRIEADVRDERNDAPQLTEDCLNYVANDFPSNIQEVRYAVRYLLTGADLGADDVVDAAKAAALLAE